MSSWSRGRVGHALPRPVKTISKTHTLLLPGFSRRSQDSFAIVVLNFSCSFINNCCHCRPYFSTSECVLHIVLLITNCAKKCNRPKK